LATGLTVKMETVPSFKEITVTSDNVYNGATAAYTVSVTPEIDMIRGDLFFITFPDEVTLPTTGSCSGVSQLSTTVTCAVLTSNKLKITLSFTSTPLTALTKF